MMLQMRQGEVGRLKISNENEKECNPPHNNQINKPLAPVFPHPYANRIPAPPPSIFDDTSCYNNE